eukprot:CAMPEP_0172906572 /NCGR_PEP_ID=MMETSP1075-20121228/177128_1 /TAXON_ID=2916 /ORGANISM="Ceratium fusus, Strain PA161109" /LENGTH=82 /DNA_ID=CAMNT_0013764041 /DNA_START=445 /DNA_END=691 /DNA_ORIENTATION=-
MPQKQCLHLLMTRFHNQLHYGWHARSSILLKAGEGHKQVDIETELQQTAVTQGGMGPALLFPWQYPFYTLDAAASQGSSSNG